MNVTAILTTAIVMLSYGCSDSSDDVDASDNAFTSDDTNPNANAEDVTAFGPPKSISLDIREGGKGVVVSWKNGVDSGAYVGTTNATRFPISVDASGHGDIRYKVGPKSEIACDAAADYIDLNRSERAMLDTQMWNDGEFALCILARGKNGKWLSERSAVVVTWLRDTLAPVGKIISPPAAVSALKSIVSAFDNNEIVAYRYKLGLEAFTDCQVADGYSDQLITKAGGIVVDLTSSSEGANMLCLVAIDKVGNRQPFASASAYKFVLDESARTPDVTWSKRPAANDNSAGFSFNSAAFDITTFRYKFGPAATTDCSVEFGYSGSVAKGVEKIVSLTQLGQGHTKFCAVAGDTTNEWHFRSAYEMSFFRDTVAPAQPNFTPALVGTIKPGIETLSGFSADTASTTIRLYKLYPGDTSSYYVRVLKLSKHGNIYRHHLKTWTLQNPIDGSIIDLDIIKSSGEYSVEVESVDHSGNVSSLNTLTFNADITPPTVDLDLPYVSHLTSHSFRVTSQDAVEYIYKYTTDQSVGCASIPEPNNADSVSPRAISSNLNVNIKSDSSSDGQLTICIKARDAVGNWSQYFPFRMRYRLASASIAYIHMDKIHYQRDSTFYFLLKPRRDEGFTKFKYKLAEVDPELDDPNETCKSADGYSKEAYVYDRANLIRVPISGPEGERKLCVIGLGKNEKWDNPTQWEFASQSLYLDKTPPIAEIKSGPSDYSNLSTVTFVIQSPRSPLDWLSGAASYKVISDNQSSESCSNEAGYINSTLERKKNSYGYYYGDWSLSVNVADFADGPLRLCLLVTDKARNKQAPEKATQFSWVKDTTPPLVSVEGAPNGISGATTISIPVKAPGLASYQFALLEIGDNSIADQCEQPSTYANSPKMQVGEHIQKNIAQYAEGKILLCVIGTDEAGNTQPYSEASTHSWIKDANTTIRFYGHPSSSTNVDSIKIYMFDTANTTAVLAKFGRPTDENYCKDTSGYELYPVTSVPLENGGVSHTAVFTENLRLRASGTYTLCAVAASRDESTQTYEAVSSVSFDIDREPPSFSITRTGDWENGSDVTIIPKLPSEKLASYEYVIIRSQDTCGTTTAEFSMQTEATSPATINLESLSPRKYYKLCVRAADIAGNEGSHQFWFQREGLKQTFPALFSSDFWKDYYDGSYDVKICLDRGSVNISNHKDLMIIFGHKSEVNPSDPSDGVSYNRQTFYGNDFSFNGKRYSRLLKDNCIQTYSVAQFLPKTSSPWFYYAAYGITNDNRYSGRQEFRFRIYDNRLDLDTCGVLQQLQVEQRRPGTPWVRDTNLSKCIR